MQWADCPSPTLVQLNGMNKLETQQNTKYAIHVIGCSVNFGKENAELVDWFKTGIQISLTQWIFLPKYTHSPLRRSYVHNIVRVRSFCLLKILNGIVYDGEALMTWLHRDQLPSVVNFLCTYALYKTFELIVEFDATLRVENWVKLERLFMRLTSIKTK